MIYAYLRVSTGQQDAAAQLSGLLAYAEKNSLTIDKQIEDTASGTKPWRDRRIAKLLDDCKPGDVLLTAEVSRLGRSTLDVLDCLRHAAERGVIVHITKQHLVVDSSLNSKIMTTMLGLAAEIERSFISQRTLEGLDNARAKGARLGRPPGQATKTKLTPREAELKKLIVAGVSVSAMARLTGTSRQTVQRFIDRLSPTTDER